MIRARAVLGVLTLVACHYGTRVQSFSPAIHPGGIDADVETRDTAFQVELLAVSDTGLLLLHNRTVMFAPYRAIRHATFQQLSEYISQGELPDSAARERLRLVSRFPQGVPTERLRALLAAYHQDSLAVLKP